MTNPTINFVLCDVTALSQFAMEKDSALVKKVGQGEVDSFENGMLCILQLMKLVVERPWLATTLFRCRMHLKLE